MTLQPLSEPSHERDGPVRPSMSWLILLIGGVLYGLACLPLILHGPKAIDPVWSAMPWLWVAPLLSYEIVDPRSLLAKSLWIVGYTVATAFVGSGAFLALVFEAPVYGRGSLYTIVLLTVYVGAFRTSVALVILLATQLARWLLRRIFIRVQGLEWRGKLVALTLIVVASTLFAYLYRERLLADATQAVLDEADRDWRTGNVDRRAHWRDATATIDGKTIERFVDPDTGLPIRTRNPWGGDSWVDFGGLYNGRVRELIAEKGAPSWALTPFPVMDEDLVEMLDSSELMETAEFPLYVNDNVSVRGSGNLLGIEVRNVEHYSYTDAKFAEGDFSTCFGPVFVGRSPKYPDVTFLRRGNEWIGAYHASGALLSAAYDDDKRIPRWPDEE